MEYFDQIILTKAELKDLKKANRGKLPFRRINPHDALINHGLLSGRRGKVHPEVASVQITDKGRRYLIYVKEKQAEKRADRRHDWAVAVISALIGAMAGGLVGYASALLTLASG